MLTRAHGWGSRVKQLFTRSVEASMRLDRLSICVINVTYHPFREICT